MRRAYTVAAMILFKTGLRYLRRRPLLSLLCVLGVALGVAVVIAIDLANESASRAFNLSTETVAGRTTHRIVGVNGVLDQDVYRRVKVDLGVRTSAPVVSAYAVAVELDEQPLQLLGVDAFAEPPFRSFLGSGATVSDDGDLSLFFTDPRALIIGAGTAERYGLRVGSELTLRIADRRETMTVIGVLHPAADEDRRALDGLAILDIGAAQRLLGMSGRITHVDLIIDERTAAGAAELERIRAAMPQGVQIVRPAQRSRSVESLGDAFRLNLTALSLLALVVGMFLIYNTITFSVVQRRPMIGTLRCLGVTRREIFRMVLVETALLGVVGGVLGVLLGIVLGRGAVGLVTQTINDLYYVVNVRDVEIAPLALVKGFALGVAASLLAALAPAYEATSVPPITALKRSSVEQRVRRVLPWVAGAGAGMFVFGVVLLLATAQLVINLAGIFFVLIGVALTTPLATIVMMRAAGPLLGALAGVTGRMSARNVTYSISRTAIAIASLMVAVSVIIGLQSMIGSFRTTVESWLNSTLTADVYVSPVTIAGARATTQIDPSTISQFRAFDGAEDVTLLRAVDVDFRLPNSADGDWKTAALLGVGSDRERPADTYVWSARPVDGLWESMRGRDEIQVSEPFANRYGITPNADRVTLRTAQGEREFRVVGVYYDYASDAGGLLMRRDEYVRLFADEAVTSIAVYMRDGEDATEAAAKMREQFAGSELLINANRQLRDSALVVFDRTFAITGALNLLATVVAFIGVLSALMALQIERTREFGMLRANGMTLRQLWRMTLMETGLMGSAAGLLSMPTGLLLAVVLVYIINLRSFGWTIRLVLDPATFVQAALVALISALLGAIYPMLRLKRLAIASAVRQE
jgi:putative ABC transport system permease protein